MATLKSELRRFQRYAQGWQDALAEVSRVLNERGQEIAEEVGMPGDGGLAPARQEEVILLQNRIQELFPDAPEPRQ